MKYLPALLFILLFGCGEQKNTLPHIVIATTMGDVEAELYPDKAPKTVAAFLSYIDKGYFKNAAFYRVIMQEGLTPAQNRGIIQGGVWETQSQLANLPGIEHETTQQTKLSHTSGTLSLARTKPGTASTEFFICIGDQTQYDYGNEGVSDMQGYAAFGKVTSGMDVVKQIQQQPANGESFIKRIEIKNIERD
ncbi:MAG: peptidylprolyl isomerase [Ferruginibacter sp.]